jgi:hypothetical protein
LKEKKSLGFEKESLAGAVIVVIGGLGAHDVLKISSVDSIPFANSDALG